MSPNPTGTSPAAPNQRLERALVRLAQSYPYPPTPDLAAREGRRLREQRRDEAPRTRGLSARLRWALVVLVLLAALMVIPPVRARVLDWLRVGAVRIFLVEPSPTPLSGTNPQVTPSPTSTPEPPEALLNLAGETTLAEAAQQAGYPLKLPTLPSDLGGPDRIYFQQIGRTSVVILVWLEPDNPDKMRMALYEIGGGEGFEKHLLEDIEETRVNGEWALWVEGPYLLKTTGGDIEQYRIVDGRTLIWSAAGITYRLESHLSLEEARQVAESLRTWEGE